MFLRSADHNAMSPVPLPLRCPGCGRESTFDPIPNFPDHIVDGSRFVGHRRCPSPACRTHVFVVWEMPQNVLASYPPQTIDFDKTDIPAPVVSCFEEVIKCQANECHRAAAMMVRKTLEVLCADRNADGATLSDRIQALRTKVVLPEALLQALDALRLLGNDAAHIDARTYSDVGDSEVKAGIALAKEILKAVYQFDALVRQLAALRKAGAPSSSTI